MRGKGSIENFLRFHCSVKLIQQNLRKAKKNILVVASSPYKVANVILANAESQNDLINTFFSHGVSVYGSCSLVFQDVFYVFGGYGGNNKNFAKLRKVLIKVFVCL